MVKESIKILFSLTIALVIVAVSTIQSHAITVTASQNPAPVNTTVTLTIDFGDTGCSYFVIWGDGVINSGGSMTFPSTFTISHTYTQAGVYNIQVQSAGCTPASPNPVFYSLRVTDFNIDRIELRFENNRSEITVNKNSPVPGLYAKIKYSGSGFLKGYWEVDGFKKSYVFKHLTVGPIARIKYPKIPPLPTYRPGNHRVRFIITHPSMNITFPRAFYYVTNEEDISRYPIRLVSPEDRTTLPYAPVRFEWQPVKRADFYQLALFSEENKEAVYAAFTPKGEYELKAKTVKSRMLDDKKYHWQVTGFNNQDKAVAQSEKRWFKFSPAATWVPGNILLISEASEQGDQVVEDVKKTYDVQVLDQYQIKTLGLNAILFYTPDDIFEIIDRIRPLKGVHLIQPNYIYTNISEPMSALQGIEKMLHLSNLKTDFKGKGISVAVVDTGVDLNHKDLENAITYSANYIPNTRYTGEIHGTGIAGLIGARINDYGINGVAPEASIFALRACRQISVGSPQGECYTNAMTKAVDDAIQKKVNIVNMSLGAMVEDDLLYKLISSGAEKGILFVAPVGNRPGMKGISFPASHPQVIAVAGFNADGSYYPDTKTGMKADICAPCKNLLTTIPGNDHNFLSGTSMSSGIVSGIIALSLEADPSFSIKALQKFNGDLDDWVQSLSKKEK